MTGPYAAAAQAYRDAGWLGVLPVVGKDQNLPRQYTGRYDRDPDDGQVRAWVESRGRDNVALRLPDDVIGIDVDAYDGRAGLQTIDHFEERFGALPRTWTSSSRTDGSGIRFFRAPSGMTWTSDLGKDSDVQVIRRGHRYAVVWPSIHPLISREYVWHAPDGILASRPPRPRELTELPPAWAAALRRDVGTRLRAPDGRDHAHDPVDIYDHEGERVDPAYVLVDGVPPGSQQNELFRYVCSLRARRVDRVEAVALTHLAIQRFENEPGKQPWAPEEDAVTIVDRVWRTYPPGATWELGGEARAFAERLARAARGENDEEVGSRPSVEVIEDVEREVNATDLGNTLRYVALHRDRVRYAADVDRWYAWDGRRWAPDVTHRTLDLTKIVVDAIRAEAAVTPGDPATRDRWLQWARTSEALARRKAIVEGARSEPALVTTSDVFDRDPHLLVVRNGTVDLHTGELRPSRPADHCTHLAEVDLDPDAGCPLWLRQVELLTNGDPVLAAYVRRAAGYSLTGDVGERSFFFLEGTGSNGKNAFIEPLMQVMGSYAQAASTALLTGGDEQHPTLLADLLGARLVFVDESRADRQLNVERLKALTGSKRVKARFIRKDFFEFDARFKLWIAGNGQPKLKDPSDGVWTRMHRVMCRGKVAEQRKIKGYGDLLYREEASGILNWALAGLREWWQLGSLGVPDSVRADVQEYRDEEDYEAQFVEEYLVRTGDPGDELGVDHLFRAYQHWARASGLKPGETKNKVHLGRSLSRLGLAAGPVKREGRTVRVVSGVRWVEGLNLLMILT